MRDKYCVIGNPIAHSKSPAIHRFWLKKLGLDGDYKARLVTDLEAYFEARRGDPDWRGCNVTAPHKEAVIPLLDEAGTIGAVNCIVREGGEQLRGRRACMRHAEGGRVDDQGGA